MFNKIGKILKAVWDLIVRLYDFWNKVIMFPWNLAIKLFRWVYG